MSVPKRPRLLIEDWLPAAAIGVECMRERGSASALAPHTYLHIWWARRPLTVSRAAVLASLMPADFPHEVFERLLGFGFPGKELVKIRQIMDTGRRVEGGFNCDRAFKRGLQKSDLDTAHTVAKQLWGESITVIDPMSGGGSIPLESARLGFRTLANEYNPVACSVLEATVDYPFRFGKELAEKTRTWAKVWIARCETRLGRFFPRKPDGLVHAYIFARTVPCPDTQFHTPLVPDWHLLKPKGDPVRVWAEPVVDKQNGTWVARIVDNRVARVKGEPPNATYNGGKGISLFTGSQIPGDYIKAKAQAGEMRSALYAVAVKKPRSLEFQPPAESDLRALAEAEAEFARLRPAWEAAGVIPTEMIPIGAKTGEPLARGIRSWADMFSPRQLLGMGVLVEELRNLRAEIIAREGEEMGEAVVHILSFGIDKFVNWNAILSSWNAPFATARSVFDRHDFAFKATFCEMAPCHAGLGLQWAISNVIEAYEDLCKVGRMGKATPASIYQGSSTSLPHLSDRSITAVVVDPPYADNVQYSELADFFYVWLKRTIGHHHPGWFSTNLCDHSEEAVVNAARFRAETETTKEAKKLAHGHYERLMTETFREAHRILRDDGVLTVMFTHKKQEAWEALFMSLIRAGFTITATWPVKTESEHSLHQAKKNAAQSTVILVARKRPVDAGTGWFDAEMKGEIRFAAQKTAERLQKEGLNPVDQLVGSFGPAMEVYSRYDGVKTDTGEPVGVDRALDEASEAVAALRIRQLAERGLEDVEPEGRFYLLCWDVLQAAEFRFNEAMLLGKAVGMDVDMLVASGLVTKSGDKVKLRSALDRRRPRKLEVEEMEETLFGPMPSGRKKRARKGEMLMVHPNDPHFRTALDACHALALRYIEAGGGNPGIGAARQLAVQQGWKGGSQVAILIEALVKAAPPALRFEKGKKSAAAEYPEFRAWYALVKPLFGVEPPEWKEELPLQTSFVDQMEVEDAEDLLEDEEAEGEAE